MLYRYLRAGPNLKLSGTINLSVMSMDMKNGVIAINGDATIGGSGSSYPVTTGYGTYFYNINSDGTFTFVNRVAQAGSSGVSYWTGLNPTGNLCVTKNQTNHVGLYANTGSTWALVQNEGGSSGGYASYCMGFWIDNSHFMTFDFNEITSSSTPAGFRVYSASTGGLSLVSNFTTSGTWPTGSSVFQAGAAAALMGTKLIIGRPDSAYTTETHTLFDIYDFNTSTYTMTLAASGINLGCAGDASIQVVDSTHFILNVSKRVQSGSTTSQAASPYIYYVKLDPTANTLTALPFGNIENDNQAATDSSRTTGAIGTTNQMETNAPRNSIAPVNGSNNLFVARDFYPSTSQPMNMHLLSVNGDTITRAKLNIPSAGLTSAYTCQTYYYHQAYDLFYIFAYNSVSLTSLKFYGYQASSLFG